MPKLMPKGICMCFNKAIVQSMFKHAASGNGLLVLILQSRSQIVLVKPIDLVELIWTTKWPGDKAFRPVKKFYELRNFTNTNRQNFPKCSFSKSMHRQQTSVRIRRKVAFFIEHSRTKKSKILLSPTLPPSPLYFVAVL